MELTWIDLLKMIPALLGGGAVGALLTNYFTNKRNRIQPVNMKLDVSYVDLPTVMKGYDAQITVTSKSDLGEVQTEAFKRLAIVRIELENIGIKDIETFDFGLNFPKGTEAIGFQGETKNRKHLISCSQTVSMTSRFSELDFIIKPFNRENKYVLTILASTDNKDFKQFIKFSHSLPIKIVDIYSLSDDAPVSVILAVELISNILGSSLTSGLRRSGR